MRLTFHGLGFFENIRGVVGPRVLSPEWDVLGTWNLVVTTNKRCKNIIYSINNSCHGYHVTFISVKIENMPNMISAISENFVFIPLGYQKLYKQLYL